MSTVANPLSFHISGISSPPRTASTRTNSISPESLSPVATTSNISQELPSASAASKKAPAVDLDPVYTFEEFLKCDEDDEELQIKEDYHKIKSKPQLQRFSNNFYDNVVLDLKDEEGPSSSSQNYYLAGRYTNQPSGQEKVGFYVVNERKQRPNFNPNGGARSSTTHHSIGSSAGSSGVGSAPRVLCASSLTTEQLEDKPPNEHSDTLHPILRRSFRSIFCDLFCCCIPQSPPGTAEREQNEFESGPSQEGKCDRMCAKCFCCFGTRSSSHNRADQYRMAEGSDAVQQEQPQRFSWEKEFRPSPRHYRFSNGEDAVLVKRNGEINGQQFIIENCKNCVLLVLDFLGSVTIDDCKSCVIVLGPCSGSVFIRDCVDCTIYSVCQQFRTRDCSAMVHLFCATRPIVEESTVQFFPLYLNYPFLKENLDKARLSPFTNLWYKVHNFTPDEGAFTVSEQEKPIGQTYGPTHDWFPDLQQERVSIDPNESYFIRMPILKKLNEGEERLIILFNRIPSDGKAEELPLYEFYSTVTFVLKRLCLNEEIVRLITTHDLTLKPGEMSNIFGKKTTTLLSGKLVSLELAGANIKGRECIESVLETIKFAGVGIHLLDATLNEQYKRNLDRLAEVQANI